MITQLIVQLEQLRKLAKDNALKESEVMLIMFEAYNDNIELSPSALKRYFQVQHSFDPGSAAILAKAAYTFVSAMTE